MKEINLREWQKNYKNGLYNSKDTGTMINAGWYDWFCSQKGLYNRFKRMSGIVAGIKDGGKVDLDKNYVFFKNNCPCVGPLYDSFKICDTYTGNVIYCINISDAREDKKFNVYSKENNWEEPIFSCDSSIDLKDWLNNKEEK